MFHLNDNAVFSKKKKANLIESWSPTVLTLVTTLIFLSPHSFFILQSSLFPVMNYEIFYSLCIYLIVVHILFLM